MVSKTQRNFDKCDVNSLKIEKNNGQTIANKQSALERKDKKKSWLSSIVHPFTFILVYKIQSPTWDVWV